MYLLFGFSFGLYIDMGWLICLDYWFFFFVCLFLLKILLKIFYFLYEDKFKIDMEFFFYIFYVICK